MYSKILNPLNNKKYNIQSKMGKQILKKYIISLIGGSENEVVPVLIYENSEELIIPHQSDTELHATTLLKRIVGVTKIEIHRNFYENELDDDEITQTSKEIFVEYQPEHGYPQIKIVIKLSPFDQTVRFFIEESYSGIRRGLGSLRKFKQAFEDLDTDIENNYQKIKNALTEEMSPV